jgi:hypothetical protein
LFQIQGDKRELGIESMEHLLHVTRSSISDLGFWISDLKDGANERQLPK